MKPLELLSLYVNKNIERRELRKEIDSLKILRSQATKIERFRNENKETAANNILRETQEQLMSFHWYLYPTIKQKIKKLHLIDSEIKKLWVESKKNSEIHACFVMLND